MAGSQERPPASSDHNSTTSASGPETVVAIGGESRLSAQVHLRHHTKPPAHHIVQSAGNAAKAFIGMLPGVPSIMPSGPEVLYPTERSSIFLNAGPQPKGYRQQDHLSKSQTQDSDSTEKSSEEGSTTDSHTSADHQQSSGLLRRRKTKKTKKKRYIRTGFQNPWDSWHKPTILQVWNGMSWKEDSENAGHTSFKAFQAAIEEAHNKESRSFTEAEKQQVAGVDSSANGESAGEKVSLTLKTSDDQEHIKLDADDLRLRVPDFDGKDSGTAHEGQVRATWLGHASCLVQMPALVQGSSEPIRVLFDPIFSARCSPTQYIGPVRLYPPPCAIADLPAIDVVAISHSHYDHLDYDSIVELWRLNSERLHFIVPLGNKAWFLGLGLGIEDGHVTELDWWDEIWFGQGDDAGQNVSSSQRLRMICTPAQHGSGRYGFDSSRTLWSSWTMEHTSHRGTFRTFFGGDTGYQFHSDIASEATVLPPASSFLGEGDKEVKSSKEKGKRKFSVCPAFAQVRNMLGPMDVALLPISVGASFNYVKSYDSFGLVPTLDSGLMGANHMTPGDAVRVSQTLLGHDPAGGSRGTAIAMHWGTYVSGIDEVRRSMQDLRTACSNLGVTFVRDPAPRVLDEEKAMTAAVAALADEDSPSPEARFACLDHGQSMAFNISSS